MNRKDNIVTFCTNFASVLHEFYLQTRSNDTKPEVMRIIETAAILIKVDTINSVDTGSDCYPSKEDLTFEPSLINVPEILFFLRQLFT